MEELIIDTLPSGHDLTAYTLRDWRSGRRYITSEYVYLDGHPYVCTAAHDASANDRPGSGTWASYWARALRPFVLYLVGPALYVTNGSPTPVATQLGTDSATPSTGANVSLVAADGSASHPNGGTLQLRGGSGSTDGEGGGVYIAPGAGDGTGGDGFISLSGIYSAADDAAAAALGVPISGLYQTSGALKIRLT